MLTIDYICTLYRFAFDNASPAEQFRIHYTFCKWWDYEIGADEFYRDINESLAYSFDK